MKFFNWKKHHEYDAHPNDHWEIDKEETPTKSITISIACIIGFFIATFIDHHISMASDHARIMSECIKFGDPNQCSSIISSIRESENSYIGNYLTSSFVDSIKAISIAVFISMIVSNVFERKNRDRLNRNLSYKIKQISSNVFYAVFGNSHPPAALQAIKDILDVPLTRPSLSVTYTLTKWSPPEEDLYCDVGEYIKIEASLDAVTRNISDPDVTPNAVRNIPIALSLPNPLHSLLKSHVEFLSIKLNGQEIDSKILEKANKHLQSELSDNSKPDAYVEICNRSLSPGEEIRVQASYTMIKEMEDTEVLRSFQLTHHLKLLVIDRTDLNLQINARALHAKPLEKAGSDKSFVSWELNDVMLPQQGIMVWWKKPLAPGFV